MGVEGCRDGQKTKQPGLCDNVNGSGMAIRRDIFIKLGGANEFFSPICDEIELCARFWREGIGSYIVEGVDFHHEPGISSRIHEDIISMGKKVDRAEMERRNTEYKLNIAWLGRKSYKIHNPVQKYKTYT